MKKKKVKVKKKKFKLSYESMILIPLGLMFILFPLSMVYKAYSSIDDKESAVGSLVGYETIYRQDSPTQRGSYTWAGIYEFEVDNKEYTCTSKVSMSPKFLIKEKANIIYDKNNPSINTTKYDIFFPLICMVVGFIVLICGFRFNR